MIGYVTMGMAVVPMIGPAFGGVLDQYFGWQANFWLLLILGLGMFWLTWSDLGETAAVSGLTLGQQFAQYPELLTSPRFWGYAIASAMSSGAFFAYLGGAPFVGTEVFGMSPAELGFFFGAPAIGYFCGNFVSGRFSARIGVNRMVLFGTLINCTGILFSMGVFWLGLGSQWTFFGFMTFVGLGNGMTIPNATAGMLSVRPHLAGTASGLGGAIMLGGGAGLSALAGALLVPGAGPWPLLWIMLVTAVCAIVAIQLVIWRSSRLAGLDSTG